jgi:hypothetical protein
MTHDTNNSFLLSYVRSVLEHLRTAHHLPAMGGSLAEVHSSSYFCLSHARTVFSGGAPCCNPVHRGGMGSGGCSG